MSPIAIIHWTEQGEAALEEAAATRAAGIAKLENARRSIAEAELTIKQFRIDEETVLAELAVLETDMREVSEYLSTINTTNRHE